MTFQPARINTAFCKQSILPCHIIVKYLRKWEVPRPISWGLKRIPSHTGCEKLYLNGKGRGKWCEGAETKPPFSEIMQQTVYQHESHITVWLLALEDSFIVINNNQNCCLNQYFQY